MGKGVEYVWAAIKKYYCSNALEEKNTKWKFKKVVRDAVKCVRDTSVESFWQDAGNT